MHHLQIISPLILIMMGNLGSHQECHQRDDYQTSPGALHLRGSWLWRSDIWSWCCWSCWCCCWRLRGRCCFWFWRVSNCNRFSFRLDPESGLVLNESSPEDNVTHKTSWWIPVHRNQSLWTIIHMRCGVHQSTRAIDHFAIRVEVKATNGLIGSTLEGHNKVTFKHSSVFFGCWAQFNSNRGSHQAKKPIWQVGDERWGGKRLWCHTVLWYHGWTSSNWGSIRRSINLTDRCSNEKKSTDDCTKGCHVGQQISKWVS